MVNGEPFSIGLCIINLNNEYAIQQQQQHSSMLYHKNMGVQIILALAFAGGVLNCRLSQRRSNAMV